MTKLRAVIDRIEGQMAVILVGNENYRIVLPMDFLPEDAAEGAVLNISVDTDPAATDQAKERVRGLIDRLESGES